MIARSWGRKPMFEMSNNPKDREENLKEKRKKAEKGGGGKQKKTKARKERYIWRRN